jgi:hypothetical protein
VNNDKFKEFIAPLLDRAVDLLDGIRSVQLMFETLPEQTIYFVAGILHGLALSNPQRCATWRDEETSTLYNFSHEEKRRMLDYVRLRIETGSSTS